MNFGYIKDEIWQQINAWNQMMLSKLGKRGSSECGGAGHTYLCDVLLLSHKKLCDELSSVTSFGWSLQDKDNKIQQIGWCKRFKTK